MTQGRFSGIQEAAFYTPDFDVAENFYGSVLGLPKVARVGNRHVFCRVRRSIVLVFNLEETKNLPRNLALPVPAHGAAGAGHVCFAADGEESAAWCVHLESAGLEFEADFRFANGARSIYVRDHADHSIEIAEPNSGRNAHSSSRIT